MKIFLVTQSTYHDGDSSLGKHSEPVRAFMTNATADAFVQAQDYGYYMYEVHEVELEEQ